MLRRCLIIEDLPFRLMNESFRRFVRSATSSDLKTPWLAESRQSAWGKTHGVFFTTMVALGVFLPATQNTLWQSSAALRDHRLGCMRHAYRPVHHVSTWRRSSERQGQLIPSLQAICVNQ